MLQNRVGEIAKFFWSISFYFFETKQKFHRLIKITNLVKINYHPLVVVGSTVELFKDFGPLLAICCQPVSHHHSAKEKL
jgi:hypothetical protein